MKKIYTLGLALAVGVSAVAAERSVSMQNKAMSLSQLQEDMLVIDSPAPAYAAPQGPQKISSIEDLYGVKTFHGYGMLNSDSKNGPYDSAVKFEKGTSNTRIVISGFPWGNHQTMMTVNLTEKTATILNSQVVGTNGAGGEDVYIYTYNLVPDPADETKVKLEKTDYITGTIADDGSITFPETVAIGASGDDDSIGWFYLWRSCSFTAFQNHNPIEADYKLVGTGKYTDCYFRYLFKDPTAFPDADVEIYQHKEDGSKIAVKNPYDTEFAKESELISDRESAGKGWMLFNIVADELDGTLYACMEPMVNCGVDMGPEYDESGNPTGKYNDDEFYLFNEEGGMYYSGGFDQLARLIDECQNVGAPLSVFEDNKIEIVNQYFGTEDAPDGYYWWTSETAVRTPGLVILPEGFEYAGISNVAADANAPVRYYNLQGVQIAAPVKGQLVIKTQGNKSMKFIGR